MLIIRSTLYFALMLLSAVVMATLVIVLGFLPFRARYQIARRFALFNVWSAKVVCGLRYTVEGQENIPEGASVIMAKHQSAWETLALQAIFDTALVWVLKRELLWLPFFGWAMALLRPIAIDRSAGRKAVKQVTEQGTHSLQRGESVVIFPEGTRIAPGERGRYGMGGALLAEKAQFPVIPIAHNAGEFWRRNAFKKYPGTIQVVIGPVIPVEGKSAAQIRNEVEQWIESTMDRISG